MEPVNRMLTWAVALFFIYLTINVTTAITCSREVAMGINYLLMLPMAVGGAWGGAMARRRGWIVSKKYL